MSLSECIVFSSKYSYPKASVSQTMGRDVQQAAKRLGYSGATSMAPS